MSKSCELNLPYFKRGDDLSWFLEKSESIPEAFAAHAEMMDVAAQILRTAKEILERHPGKAEVHADTHMVEISGDDALIDELVAAEVASIPEWMEEEEEWDEGHPDGDSEDDE